MPNSICRGGGVPKSKPSKPSLNYYCENTGSDLGAVRPPGPRGSSDLPTDADAATDATAGPRTTP